MIIQAVREHEICAGHRVVGHESKCAHLHGHGYVIEFHCEARSLDQVGRIIDFSAIKQRLCMWLEDNWDHRMLLWCEDPLLPGLEALDPSVQRVPFNPTAENMAKYLLTVIGIEQLRGTEVTLRKVVVHETRKCSASALRENSVHLEPMPQADERPALTTLWQTTGPE
jgi:6-pyruvoyltetrahydropterin/6-carboxytetrahydropterin synthase